MRYSTSYMHINNMAQLCNRGMQKHVHVFEGDANSYMHSRGGGHENAYNHRPFHHPPLPAVIVNNSLLKYNNNFK